MPKLSTPLAALMYQRGVSITELARLVDVHRSTISRVASGQQKPSVETARRVAEVFEIDPGDLWGAKLQDRAYAPGSTNAPGYARP